MEPSAARFAEKLVFVEKDVDHARAELRTFRIFSTPTFVVLDARGEEVDRFGYIPTAAGFEQRLARYAGD
ncbi:MAG: hypothetical protein HY331_06985 [Chloroflexi bacterium]|nr:hypothetical protein [Chloroflexota bacterium]